MIRRLSVSIVVLSCLHQVSSAQSVLYRETFGRPQTTGNRNLPNWDWQRFNANGASSGTATTGGGVSGDGEVGGRPVDVANTETAGPNEDGTFAVYPEGWQYMDGTQALSITTEYTFDPAAAAPVTFRWWQGAAQIAGVDQQSRVAVRIGASSWFVSNETFTNPPVTSGANFGGGNPADPSAQTAVERSLLFNPAAANWLTLNFDGNYDPVANTATGSTLGNITVGAAAAGPLVGNITGFGLFRGATGANMRFDTFTIEGDGPTPGDVDGDDDVDMNDFAVIQSNFQKSLTGRANGDLIADGVIDWRDFRAWKTNHPFPAVAASGAVPEPATLALGLIAIGSVLAFRR